METSTTNRLKKALITTIIFGAVLGMAKDAPAALIQFNAMNSPRHNAGLFLRWKDPFNGRDNFIHRRFSFDNVSMVFNTAGSGQAVLQGAISDTTSGDIWHMNAVFNGISSTAGGGFPGGVVPYDQMFDDLMAAGFGSTAALHWDEMSLMLVPDAANPIPTYTGSRNLMEQQNRFGDSSVLRYRKNLNPALFPGPEFDVFGLSAWMRNVPDPNSTVITHGDFHFILKDPFIIPEPGTMALMGIGFSGLGLIRRKKKA